MLLKYADQMLWPGRGGNARKDQGKSLTKFVLGLHGEI
jgi:hypothetical protein